MKGKGKDFTQGHLDESTLLGTYTTVTPSIDHAKTFLVVLWTE
jgi:hypothetical protein